MGELSPFHLLFVLVIALIVTGPGKLPEVGAALGKTIREFRAASSDVRDAGTIDVTPASSANIVPVGIATSEIGAPITSEVATARAAQAAPPGS